ncbi:P-loop containing nucleoside triphosphate hydrolase protein [Powellomyces hirtus]|nr:P-loop containing nucleoside triphosphate hydrolase protein [Powellomyces hirtus]
MQHQLRKSRKTRTQEDATGSIAHVELVNFMCHKYLAVPLGPKINFIVGHNGSGKSAILTALAVCLGGRANITNRAASLKEFLKEGTNIGSVTVTIRNEGSDAYRPEDYGDAITIERKIRREGSNSYKIKSARGNVISTKRDELLAIMDNMQIHADNPMTILTQDAARSFLANSTPNDKYKFFMTGTGLRQLSADYSIIGESIQTMNQTLRHKESVLPDMKKEWRKLEATLRDLEQARDLGATIDGLKCEWAWAQVIEKEEEVQGKASNLERAEFKSETAQVKAEECSNELRSLEKQIVLIQDKISEQQLANDPLAERKEEVKGDMMQIRQRLKDFQVEKEDMNREVIRHRNMMTELQARIAEETRKLEGDSRTTRKQQITAISEREQQKLVTEGQLRQLQAERESNDTEVAALTDNFNDAKRRFQEFQSERRGCEERIRNLQSQDSDRLGVYGPGMRQTLQMIEQFAREGRWKGAKPIGPIGIHVKLHKEEFARTIETVLGNSLNSFVVEYQEDLLLLQREIFSKTRCRSSIVRFQSRNTDFSSGEPDPQYLTILRALEISNEVVLQQLVINHHIEQTVLVHTRDEGHRITSPSFPRNIIGVYTQDGFQVGNRGGGLSTQAPTLYRGQPRLMADTSSFIREEDNRMAQIDAQIESFEPTVNDLHRRLNDLKQHQQKLRQDYAELQREINARANEIARMNEELMDEEETNIIGTLREAYAVEEGRIEAITMQYEALEEQRAALQETERPLREQFQHLEREQNVIHERHQTLSNELTEAVTKRVTAETEREHWLKQLEKYEQRVTDAKTHLQEAQDALADLTGKVEQLCDRVEVTGTPDEIERQLRQLRARLNEIERTHGNYDDVQARYVSKKTAYMEAKREVERIRSFIQHVGDALRERMRMWTSFRYYISARAKMLFGELMRRRGYRGKLILNHKKLTLGLRVTINSNDHPEGQGGANGQEKDPRSLSGGEKSFSTVCLLLSLWESMGSPFRALDEFDVFMDAVNRRSSMTAMIENAREQDRPCQYIFITPQTMGNVPGLNGPDVRVHRLLDPERGQTRLDGGGGDDDDE